MLFSRPEVASFLNRNFESAWEMVRPVPIIRIDFGNGHVATRTLHGNVASYVCAGDGQILDLLPGVYTPPVYTAALEQIRLLANSLTRVEGDRQSRLRDYHRERVQTLRNNPTRLVYAPPEVASRYAFAQPGQVRTGTTTSSGRASITFRFKDGTEARVEQIVLQAPQGNFWSEPRRPQRGNLANSELLAIDTWTNETQRRLTIHERFAQANPVRPEQIKRWLYKDILHADLDDPYLGLGDALIGDDVFREMEG